jgi:hypothetical protein
VLVQVTAPGPRGFCAGLTIGPDDRCTSAAPVLAWAVGHDAGYLRAYFARRGWRAIVVVRRPPDPL